MSDEGQKSMILLPKVPREPEVYVRQSVVPRAERDTVLVYLAGYESAHSRVTMRDRLIAIARILGTDDPTRVPWGDLDHAHVALIRSRLAQQFAPSSVNLALSALRGILKTAWKLGHMPHERYVRAADIRGVKGSRLPPGRALTPDEIARLRAFCAEETGIFGALLRGVIAVLLGGGARREEACTLEVTSFDGESLEILGKGNKERRVPLSFEARRDLAAWVDVRDTLALTIDALFVRAQRDGRLRKRPFSPDGMYELIVWLGEASGVGELATHDLRRTFATARLDAGVDVLVVQRLLGHASPATTAKYDMRAEREARRAVENAEVY